MPVQVDGAGIRGYLLDIRTEFAMRVILAQPRGFCAGVERAIEIVEKALDRYGPPVYVRHEIVHNKRVVQELTVKGARFVEELDEIPDGAITVFSAHGVAQSVEDTASDRSLPVLDATCPLVAKVHKEGQRYAEKGFEVVLIGHEGHPEVVGTMGRIPGIVHLVQDTGDVETLSPANPDKLAYVTQTTLSVDDTREVIEALKDRFPGIAGPDVKDICYATQNRQAAVRKLSETVDLILVVGGAEQLELEPAARDRRRRGHAQLPCRGGRCGRSGLVRQRGGGRRDGWRLDPGASGRRGDRPAARDRPGRAVHHGRHRGAYPLQAAGTAARGVGPARRNSTGTAARPAYRRRRGRPC